MEKYIFPCPACGNKTEILIDEKKVKDIDFSHKVAINQFSKCTECGESTDFQIEITSQNTDNQN